ncbi:MAG: NYN domain-containing protein [Acidimicrobiia bacterium]
MPQDHPAAIEAMIRTPGVAVIIDGYNVSMLAWPDAKAAEQRDRLCDALAEFQLRFRCEVTVVFDGAEVPGVRPMRRRGLRIVFSAAGQEADEVVVGEVMFRPRRCPSSWCPTIARCGGRRSRRALRSWLRTSCCNSCAGDAPTQEAELRNPPVRCPT